MEARSNNVYNISIGHFPELRRKLGRWKDLKRKEIRKQEQDRFLRKCLEENVTPKGLRIQKKGVECKTFRWRKLLKKMEKELIWNELRKKKEEIAKLKDITKRK